MTTNEWKKQEVLGLGVLFTKIFKDLEIVLKKELESLTQKSEMLKRMKEENFL